MLQAALNRWFGPTQSSGVPVRGSGLEPFFMMQLRMIAMTPPVLVSASEVSSFPGRCKSGVQSQLPPWVSEKITTDPLFESDCPLKRIRPACGPC